MFEWNEADFYGDGGSHRGLRGGSVRFWDYMLRASTRDFGDSPTHEGSDLGFRVAEVLSPPRF